MPADSGADSDDVVGVQNVIGVHRDLVRVVAQFGEDLVGMFAECATANLRTRSVARAPRMTLAISVMLE